MTLFCQTLDLPPDPLALAGSLRGRPGLFLLWDSTGRGPSYVGSDPDAVRTAWDPEPELVIASARPDGAVPRWFGLLPYEAARALERWRQRDPRPAAAVVAPTWWRYPSVVEIGGTEGGQVRVLGTDRDAVAVLARRLATRGNAASGPVRLAWSRPPEDARRHVERIERALELIRAGQIYQVNLARRFEFEVEGHPLDHLRRIAPRAPSPFSAAFSEGDFGFVSSSPELFLEFCPPSRLRTEPIKGTRPADGDPERDRRAREELEDDPKERAELSMIVDVERNDLGRVSVAGSVRVLGEPEVKVFGAVQHRLARIESELVPGIDRAALLRATLPSGSVTGAPKLRAMEIIAELEPHRRGLYTGAYGTLGQDGGLRLAMAIRVLCIHGGHAQYFAGGGIVADSDPEREVEETLWKARQVLALLP